MERKSIALFVALAAAATALFVATDASAQTAELTPADRLALLYTSQMVFDASGEPIVKVGIADGLDEVAFTPTRSIRVLPTGPGGPELELPSGHTYTVKLTSGQSGRYEHFVVLERLLPGDKAALAEAEKRWADAGVVHQTIEVGSLFAIAGHMFDNRETLLTTVGYADETKARTQLDALEKAHGAALSLHAELTAHATAELSIEGVADGVVLHHKDLLWIDLGDGEARVSNVPLETGKKEDRDYAEALVFAPDRSGRLALVNAVRVETVLRGVVPAEIYASAPSASLEVQAIAARGTLVSQIGTRHLADPYNLCDEQHCQVFGGMDKARETTDAAIVATRGDILFAGKRIAETYYSSNSGGLSASAEEVWGISDRDYLQAHWDSAAAYDPAQPLPRDASELRTFLTEPPDGSHSETDAFGSGKHFRWTRTLSAAELDEVVGKRFAEIGRVRDVHVVTRGTGMRVVELEIVGERGSRRVERELPVRRLFGGLKSGLFVIDLQRDGDGFVREITFTGGGFGHGVGMDQTGAMSMAGDGKSSTEILDHYYRGTEVRGLW